MIYISDQKEDYNKIKITLLNYISSNPNDINARLKLIIHCYNTMRIEICDILDYLEELLKYDPSNIKGLLILLYVQRFNVGIMNEKLIDQVKNIHTDDLSIKALISLGISWYYELEDDELKQERWLLQAIDYNPYIVQPYYDLIILYFGQGRTALAKSLIPKALKNIMHIYSENDEYLLDTTNIDEFFNAYYTENHVSADYIENLKLYQNVK